MGVDQKIPEQTDDEVNRKLLHFSEFLLEEQSKQISSLEAKIHNCQKVIKLHNEMFEWLKLSCANVNLLNYGFSNVKEYIDAFFEEEKELLEKIK